MRLFFSKHELKLRRKRTIAAIICVVLVLGVYWILTRPQKAAPEMPTVIVEPVVKDDVDIRGVCRAYSCPTVRRSPCPGGRLSGKYAFCRRYICQ